MTCGWVVHTLQYVKGFSEVRSYRVIFFAYAVIGLIKFVLAISLSQKCEVEKVAPERDSETTPLLGGNGTNPKKSKPSMSLLPSISPESRIIVFNLCLLFALDAFASGLAPLYVFNRMAPQEPRALIHCTGHG
jgi:hypothetical protein